LRRVYHAGTTPHAATSAVAPEASQPAAGDVQLGSNHDPARSFADRLSGIYYQNMCHHSPAEALRQLQLRRPFQVEKGHEASPSYVRPVRAEYAAFFDGPGASNLSEQEARSGSRIQFLSNSSDMAYVIITGPPSLNVPILNALSMAFCEWPNAVEIAAPGDEQTVTLEMRLLAAGNTYYRGKKGAGLIDRRKQFPHCSIAIRNAVSRDFEVVVVTGPESQVKSLAKNLQPWLQMPHPPLLQYHDGTIAGAFNLENEPPDGADTSRNGLTTMRNLMRSIPHSVVLVTAARPSSPPSSSQVSTSPPVAAQSDRFAAMTISSMTTVTLSPVPIISFNVKQPSRTLNAIQTRESFFIHLLHNSISGAQIAAAFARGDTDAGYQALENAGAMITLDDETFPHAPKIAAIGISGTLSCRLLPDKCVEVGDHVIVVAQVCEIEFVDGDGGGVQRVGLAYHDGAYKSIGDALDLAELGKDDLRLHTGDEDDGVVIER
jgi:flavin reductase (DIM6/NTAB) family NADH-FMN oxidoreductase RutF